MKNTTQLSFVLIFVSFISWGQTQEFADDFDLDLGWTGGWSRGSVATSLDTDADGSYMHTGSSYIDNATLTILSPQIDLTGATGLGLFIDIRYDTESSADGFEVEYSDDDGVTWAKLGALGEGKNWYNSTEVSALGTGENGWSGDNGTWQAASIALPSALNGNDDTRFRIIFQSNGSNSAFDGVAFDNFEVWSDAGSLLPVELKTFTGSAINHQVTLQWSTSSELNNDYFEVQRSTDKSEFGVIGRVNGNGTTNELRYYDFIDRNPKAGVNYYRLRQVDFDGAEEFHKIIRVDNDFASVATVYPNPGTASDLKIKFASGDDRNPLQLQIISLDGTVLHLQSINASSSIDQPLGDLQLNPGLYFLQLVQGDYVMLEKLVIE